MKCHVCGSQMQDLVTDIPFKKKVHCIVVIKDLPVHQCGPCGEYLIDDDVMIWIESALAKVDPSTELEIVRYAA